MAEGGGRARGAPIQDVNVITDAHGSRRAALTHFCLITKAISVIGPGSTSRCAFGAIGRLIARRAFIPVRRRVDESLDPSTPSR